MAAVQDDVLRLPFDQYQRYRLVADLLDTLRDGDRPLRVLDVGGGTAVLRRFDAKDDITLVDVVDAGVREGMVVGDGCRLPFGDDAFEVVCAFDTLEHVPPPRRGAFVDECARVASRWVVLAGPYDAPGVRRAEETLQRLLRDKLSFVHHYLEEHRAHGLPDRDAVERRLRERGADVATLGQANLERWLALMVLSLVLDHDPALRDLAGEVHAFYNRNLYASDHAKPVYRHVVVAAFAGAPLPAVASLQPREAAPAEALAPFTLLTAELAAFDRERERWRHERAAFEGSVATLRADLTAHEATVARLREDLESARHEAAESIEKLELDLGAHRETLADRTDRLEEHRGVLADRERQLEEHKRVLRDLEDRFRGQQAELTWTPIAALRRVRRWLRRSDG